MEEPLQFVFTSWYPLQTKISFQAGGCRLHVVLQCLEWSLACDRASRVIVVGVDRRVGRWLDTKLGEQTDEELYVDRKVKRISECMTSERADGCTLLWMDRWFVCPTH